MITSTLYKCGLRPFSMFRGIVAISLLAIVSLPLYMFFFVSPSLVNYISDLKEEEAVDLAIHMESKLIPDKSQVLIPSILTEDIIKRLKGTCLDFNLLKARILLPHGEILFSTDESEVGENIHQDSGESKHLSSKTYTKFIEKGSPDLEGDISCCDIVETYVPIMRNNTFIGGFEIYHDVTADRERLDSLLKLFNLALFPIVLILFSAVIISCRKANNALNKLIEAEASLSRKSLELEQNNEDLTALVAECQERRLQLEEEQKARLEAQNQVKEEQAKREKLRVEFLRHMVQAQEEERARIARELHDETAQTLTAASLNFCTLRKMLEGNTDVADVVDRLQELCRKMNKDLYRLVHDLRPAQLDDLGLVAALRYLTDEGQRGTGVKVTFNTIGSVKRLEPFVETIIFRVVQEALTNVIRHAETDEALVELDFSSQQLVILRVSDKGKGFESSGVQLSRPGWGLVGMAERVESIHGVLTIDSAPDRGTTIKVVIECFPPVAPGQVMPI